MRTILRPSVLLAVLGLCLVESKQWWQTTTVYQVYISNFKDSDGDGIGDLNGITSRMEHMVDMGVETIWLTPFYESPMADGGYDISDFRQVYSLYGTLDDFDRLVKRAHELGLKVVIDFVPNHTSSEHEWFKKSVKGIKPYDEYYVWHEGKIDENGVRHPPNNWLSVFNSGSAWEWVPERNAYYLHQFSEVQPDLDFNNPLVQQEMKDTLTFWLDRGIDGIRIDSVAFLIEDPLLRDEPPSGMKNHPAPDFYSLAHPYVINQEGSYKIIQSWAEHLANYTRNAKDNRIRIMMTEAYGTIDHVSKWYYYDSNIPFNFYFVKDRRGIDNIVITNAQQVKDIIDLWMDNMPEGGTANWVIGNHDNNRVATRYGKLADLINTVLLLLPGVTSIYAGDEIGMTDGYVSWEDTIDPQGCNSGPDRYQSTSRDPARTPFQWDDSVSAGFSTNNKTLLPVNSNYKTLNLAAEKAAKTSTYKLIQSLIKLRNTNPVVRNGNLTVRVIDTALVFTREYPGYSPITVVANVNENPTSISLNEFESVSDELQVLASDTHSGIEVGTILSKQKLMLPPAAALVLTSK